MAGSRGWLKQGTSRHIRKPCVNWMNLMKHKKRKDQGRRGRAQNREKTEAWRRCTTLAVGSATTDTAFITAHQQNSNSGSTAATTTPPAITARLPETTRLSAHRPEHAAPSSDGTTPPALITRPQKQTSRNKTHPAHPTHPNMGSFHRLSLAVRRTMRGHWLTTDMASVKLLPWLGHKMVHSPGGGTASALYTCGGKQALIGSGSAEAQIMQPRHKTGMVLGSRLHCTES